MTRTNKYGWHTYGWGIEQPNSERTKAAQTASNLAKGDYATDEVLLGMDQLGRAGDYAHIYLNGKQVGTLHHAPGTYREGDWSYTVLRNLSLPKEKTMYDRAPFKTAVEAFEAFVTEHKRLEL